MKSLSLLLALALAYSAEAQHVISGKLTDATTGQPIQHAMVSIFTLSDPGSINPGMIRSASQTTSDVAGKFELKADIDGIYELHLFHISYFSKMDSLEVNSNMQINVQMVPNITVIEATTVSAVRSGINTPVTATTLYRDQIQTADQSKDFPFVLNTTPSTVISSDAGNGVGYTGIRIRGIDPTRVNVTINDIPLNDGESQSVYWVDLPDLASSSSSVQVQRGVGGSSNGASSFGASVNIQTIRAKPHQSGQSVSLAYGSFNTQRLSLEYYSPALAKSWYITARGSYIHSDGFIDRATSELKSGMFSLSKYSKKSTFRFNAITGHERTYQAWWGNPAPKFNEDAEELNRYTNQLWISGKDLENLESSDPWTYNYYTYDNEVDDYGQNHLQAFYYRYWTTRLTTKVALHYTRGKGYFEQFIASDALSNYGLAPQIVGQDTIAYSEIVRRRWLDNHFYGTVVSAHYNAGPVLVTLGGALNEYLGRHFGEVIQTDFSPYEDDVRSYYDNEATKQDGNVYLKFEGVFSKWMPYLDLQYRGVNYDFIGLDPQTGSSPQNATYSFFNPKAGIKYELLPHITTRLMAGIANREPVRDDLVNSTVQSRPSAERLQDLELGADYRAEKWRMSITGYYMDYDSALVLTGQVNDVGAYTRTNVGEALRKGIEVEGEWRLLSTLSLGGNLSLSSNKILSFTEYVDDWDNGGQLAQSYTDTDIALSPNSVGTLILLWKYKPEISIQLIGKSVGAQYLDNTQNEDRRLDGFSSWNMMIAYQPKVKFKKLAISAYLNNLTNARYAPNGYTFSGIISGQREHFNHVYPMAGFNWMLKIRLELGKKETWLETI